jgi:Mn-dependent DtxR family transcriptional regulator
LKSEDLSHLFGVSSRKVRVALQRLLKQGAIQQTQASWSLTNEGRTRATSLVRSHRLWEVYLEKHYPQDTHQLHHAASRLEHVTTDTMKQELGDAEIDPHGSPVPDDE